MIADHAPVATYTAATGAVFLGLTGEVWGIIAACTAVVLGLCTFALGWYYKHQTLKQLRG